MSLVKIVDLVGKNFVAMYTYSRDQFGFHQDWSLYRENAGLMNISTVSELGILSKLKAGEGI